MKLTIHPRKNLKKGETNRIRREGNIPGVLYGKGQENETITLKGSEIQAVLRNLKSGQLATTVFELSGEGKPRKAIVKDIHYHPANYAVEHIDLSILRDDQLVTVNIPIRILGVDECVGIKLGGFLRQVIRTIQVSCLPKDIPQEFTLDIRALDINECKRLSDLEIPKSVRPLAVLNEVAVVVAKARALVEPTPAPGAAVAAVPGEAGAAAIAPAVPGAPGAAPAAAAAPAAGAKSAAGDKKPPAGKK